MGHTTAFSAHSSSLCHCVFGFKTVTGRILDAGARTRPARDHRPCNRGPPLTGEPRRSQATRQDRDSTQPWRSFLPTHGTTGHLRWRPVSGTHTAFMGFLFLLLISHAPPCKTLSGMTDDIFLLKPLMPKNGFTEGNVHFAVRIFIFLQNSRGRSGYF